MLTRESPRDQARVYARCVLSPELELRDLDARHWRNAWRLLTPPRLRDKPRWALVVLDGERALKVVIAGDGARGSIDPTGFPGTSESALAAFADSLGVGALLVVERGLLAALSSEIEAALRPDQDGIAQILIALRAVKRHVGRRLWSHPPLLEILPAPAYDSIQRTFDLLIPDASALLAYVIEDDRARVHTSVIAVKQQGDIVRAATHRAIDDVVGEAAFARDWRNNHGRVLAAVEARFAKPAIGLFLERATWMRIVTGPSDQLAREMNAKNVVIDPAPGWLLGLLGSSAVAAMASRTASVLASLLPQVARERASALAQRAQTAIKESGAHPFALLGYDPIELWSRFKHLYRE
jgi:hypothetical protein